ncbi:hypothetical protein D0868_14070 [Hortaea werneckii]|uniref:PQ loop repeat protein n=1 Tax=Hortaea werneckii TaxID=91943 RepID=A0A3M6XKQ6_HORWE|nr:hypothetical protein D0868_14070 [Hortaea werneckii]
MPWLHTLVLEPSLPTHCEPTNDFLFRFSRAFHTCVPTPLAFTSNVLGTLSIVAWLFAQLPQIYKNWSLGSTSGLSIYFLVEWCLGDISNLLGALFTHQAKWQVAIGGYYVFVDLCLVGQWIWYEKLKHGNMMRKAWLRRDSDRSHPGAMAEVIDGLSVDGSSSGGDRHSNDDTKKGKAASRPRIIFRQPTFERERKPSEHQPSSSPSATPRGTTIHRVTTASSSSPLRSPSPRTLLLLACLAALTHATPLPTTSHLTTSTTTQPTPLETAGTILSWLSTALYLTSRLPQLLKNFSRKSTAGLSPTLFLAAFGGNFFYSAALLANPLAWSDMGPYGGGGWAGAQGSKRAEWIGAALPFFLGAAGVLGLDGGVGVQFLLYGGGSGGGEDGGEGKVLVLDAEAGRWRWRRVSGWLRGWVPRVSSSEGGGGAERVGGEGERTVLVPRDEVGGGRGEGYGTA